MAQDPEMAAVTKAFTGKHGVDEKPMVEYLAKWKKETLTIFRKETHCIFKDDETFDFEKWEECQMEILRYQFLRFWNAVVQWTTHPWERDARLVKQAVKKGAKTPESYGIIIEVACTRTSEELLGARRAYHSLYGKSMEEKVAERVEGSQRKLLVGLVSAYRYEGKRGLADKKKTKMMKEAGMLRGGIDDYETVRILTTRSKDYIKRTIEDYYLKKPERNIDEDFKGEILDTINCLYAPAKYFSKVLDDAFKFKPQPEKGCKIEPETDALARVIVTRAHVDLKDIAEEYKKTYKVSLTQKIGEVAGGNYKDFLLALVKQAGAN